MCIKELTNIQIIYFGLLQHTRYFKIHKIKRVKQMKGLKNNDIH